MKREGEIGIFFKVTILGKTVSLFGLNLLTPKFHKLDRNGLVEMFSMGVKLLLTTFLWLYLQNQKSLITCTHHKLVFPFYHDTSNNITLYHSYGKDGPAPCWEKIIEKRFVLVRVWALKANPLTTQTCTLHVPKMYVYQNDYGGLQLSHQNQMLIANSNRSQQVQNAHTKFKSPKANYK